MVNEVTEKPLKPGVGGRFRAVEFYNLRRKSAADPLQVQAAVTYRTTTRRRILRWANTSTILRT
jgi:hypothetical protein